MPELLNSVHYVFLDRDGVINVKLPQHQYVTSPEVLLLCPGAAEAVAKLNHAGMNVLVVTNQRGISLGILTEKQLELVHQHLQYLLAVQSAQLDAIYYCPHALGSCNCRKPLPGMFHQAFRDFPGATPGNSLMIGDSLSDIQAGRNLGMPTVFIAGDPSTQDPGADQARDLATYHAPSLAAFIDQYL